MIEALRAKAIGLEAELALARSDAATFRRKFEDLERLYNDRYNRLETQNHELNAILRRPKGIPACFPLPEVHLALFKSVVSPNPRSTSPR